MNLADVLKLLIYSAGMASGQILFKSVARRMAPGDNVISVITDPLFILAGTVYFGLTLVWIWILTTVPLSRAYPLSFLSIVMVSVASRLVFGEAMSATYLAGLACTMLGLMLIATG